MVSEAGLSHRPTVELTCLRCLRRASRQSRNVSTGLYHLPLLCTSASCNLLGVPSVAPQPSTRDVLDSETIVSPSSFLIPDFMYFRNSVPVTVSQLFNLYM